MAMGREQCPTGLFVCSSVHLSSHPTLSLRGAFETGSSVGLIDDSPFTSFQGWSLRWPFRILLRKIIEHCLFLCLSPPGDCWCGVLGFVPTASVSSSSTHEIFRDEPLVVHALPASWCALSFPLTPCPKQHSHRSC